TPVRGDTHVLDAALDPFQDRHGTATGTRRVGRPTRQIPQPIANERLQGVLQSRAHDFADHARSARAPVGVQDFDHTGLGADVIATVLALGSEHATFDGAVAIPYPAVPR